MGKQATKSIKILHCIPNGILNFEFRLALLVSDRYQRQGIDTELVRRLLQVGHIPADILTDNHGMQRVCEKLGFLIERTSDSTVVKAEIALK